MGVIGASLIPELVFRGDSLLIEGEGLIAASSLADLLNQPLDLNLGFGAKGKLEEHLDVLQLLGARYRVMVTAGGADRSKSGARWGA